MISAKFIVQPWGRAWGQHRFSVKLNCPPQKKIRNIHIGNMFWGHFNFNFDLECIVSHLICSRTFKNVLLQEKFLMTIFSIPNSRRFQEIFHTFPRVLKENSKKFQEIFHTFQRVLKDKFQEIPEDFLIFLSISRIFQEDLNYY